MNPKQPTNPTNPIDAMEMSEAEMENCSCEAEHDGYTWSRVTAENCVVHGEHESGGKNKMSEKKIGKIMSVSVGFGGYDDAMFGVSFRLAGNGWVTNDFWGTWANRTGDEKWTEQEQINFMGDVVLKLKTILNEARLKRVQDLQGVPIEVLFENQKLKSWRILTEVI